MYLRHDREAFNREEKRERERKNRRRLEILRSLWFRGLPVSPLREIENASNRQHKEKVEDEDEEEM